MEIKANAFIAFTIQLERMVPWSNSTDPENLFLPFISQTILFDNLFGDVQIKHYVVRYTTFGTGLPKTLNN